MSTFMLKRSHSALNQHFPQCTVMSVNVIFVDIDWNKARHDTPKSTRRNMTILHETIAGIVRQMTPAVLCMCEVGAASDLLTEVHMQEIANTNRKH